MKINKIILLILLSLSSAYAIALNPDNVLAVVEEKANRVDFYNANTNAWLGGTEVGNFPHEIALSPNHQFAFVSNFGVHDYDQTTGTPGNSISVIDLSNFKEKYKLITGVNNAPHGLKIRPQHDDELYVNTEIDNRIVVFDLKTQQIKRSFAVIDGTHNFIFSPDGKWLWLMSGKNGISKLNADTGALIGQFKSDTPIRGLSYSNDYQQLILSGNNEIVFLDPNSLQLNHKIGPLNSDQILYSVVTPNGKYILAPAVWNNELLIIDTQSEKIIARIVTGADPVNIVISSDSQYAYISNGRSSHVSKVNLQNFLVTEIDTQPGSNGLALFSKNIDSTTPPQPKNNLAIAALLPLSGNDWKHGRDVMLGYEFFRDYINQHGGIKIGDKSYHLNIYYADTQSQADHFAELAKQLRAQYSIKAMINGYNTDLQSLMRTSNLAVIPFFAKLTTYDQIDKFLFGDFSNLAGLQTAYTNALDLTCSEETLRAYLTLAFFKHSMTDNLYLPVLKQRNSPGIILLHSSAGVKDWDYDWAKLLRNHGYSVFILDSFTPRGYVDRKTIGWDLAYQAQLADLNYAYQLFTNIADLDSKRIALVGYSLGGYSTLKAMAVNPSLNQPLYPAFKLAASFYGHAQRFDHSNFTGKIALFWGDDDDRAPLAGALALVENSKRNNIELYHYANAKHGFDNPYLPESLEMIDEEGNLYHLGYNAKAHQHSINDLLSFLDHL